MLFFVNESLPKVKLLADQQIKVSITDPKVKRDILLNVEVAVRIYSSKWKFLKILHYSQEDTWLESLLETQHRCFPVNIAKFFINSFFYRSLRWHMFFKIEILKNLALFTGKYLSASLVETPTQVFSCQYFQIFKNTFFLERKHSLF